MQIIKNNIEFKINKKMIQKLKTKVEGLTLFICPTMIDKRQFETNIKNEYLCAHLHQNIEVLTKHFNYIGKEVYLYSNNKSVTTIEDFKLKESEDLNHSLFNPIDEKAFIYTKEDFVNFQNWYINYQIEHFAKELINSSPYQISTNQFSNLCFQWIVESKQELIRFFKEIINLKIN